MTVRGPCLVLACWLVAAPAIAHVHKADAAAGGSGATASFVIGPYASFAHDVKFTGIDWPGVMLVGDISNHLFGERDEGETKLVYSLGLRLWLPIIAYKHKWHTFVQANYAILRDIDPAPLPTGSGAVTATALMTDTKHTVSFAIAVERELMWGTTSPSDKERPFAWRAQADWYPWVEKSRARFTASLVYRWHPD